MFNQRASVLGVGTQWALGAEPLGWAQAPHPTARDAECSPHPTGDDIPTLEMLQAPAPAACPGTGMVAWETHLKLSENLPQSLELAADLLKPGLASSPPVLPSSAKQCLGSGTELKSKELNPRVPDPLPLCLFPPRLAHCE